jgi:hypothetical protein
MQLQQNFFLDVPTPSSNKEFVDVSYTGLIGGDKTQ